MRTLWIKHVNKERWKAGAPLLPINNAKYTYSFVQAIKGLQKKQEMENEKVHGKHAYRKALINFKGRCASRYFKLLKKYRIWDSHNNMKHKMEFLEHIMGAVNPKPKRKAIKSSSQQHAALRQMIRPYAQTLRSTNLTSASLSQLLSDAILAKTNDFCNVSTHFIE